MAFLQNYEVIGDILLAFMLFVLDNV